MIASEWLTKWRFGFLLLAILVALVIEPIVFGPRAASWIFDVTYSALLVAAVYAVTGRRRGRFWVIGLALLAFLATWVAQIVPSELTTTALVATVIRHVLGIGFLLLIVLATLKGLFLAKEVNLDIVMGSLAGYLLLGTAWALIFSLVHVVSPDAFDFGRDLDKFIADGNSRFTVFIYYSFTTLTTLGYGDISPVSQTARTLCWFEATIGQFYIATLVAGIVGIIASGHAQKRIKRAEQIAGTGQTKKRQK